jgi:hypothetical protein
MYLSMYIYIYNCVGGKFFDDGGPTSKFWAAYVCVYMHACMCVSVRVCRVSMYVCSCIMCMYMHVSMCIMCMYMQLSTYVYMYTYPHMQAHSVTHTDTQKLTQRHTDTHTCIYDTHINLFR